MCYIDQHESINLQLHKDRIPCRTSVSYDASSIPADMLTDSAAAGRRLLLLLLLLLLAPGDYVTHWRTALPCATDAIIYRQGIALLLLVALPQQASQLSQRKRSFWPPYVAHADIIFSSCRLFFFFLSFFFSSPNLSRRRVDVCHTCTHGVALVRI